MQLYTFMQPSLRQGPLVWLQMRADHAVRHNAAVGALVGLAVGFYVKYKLDRKYVFVNSLSEVQQ